MKKMMMMPLCGILLAAALFLASGGSVAAQSLTLFDVDASDFPTIRAKFYALGPDGKPLAGLTEEDFTVTEGGTGRKIVRIDCPDPSPPRPLSSVLTIDISGSMVEQGARIDIARAAAHAWINTLPLGISECALTSFNGYSYLNQDFTVERSLLQEAIDSLKPKGSTDYNKAFLDPYTGAIPVAEGGRHRRIVVFMTDGLGEGDEEAIVSAALAADVVVYCVAVYMRAPAILRNIAERTGGTWFENVTSASQGEEIYRSILQESQGGEPCEIEWLTEPGCISRREVVLSIPEHGLSASGTYEVPDGSLPQILVDPAGLAFGGVAPGTTRDLPVTLTALNGPVTVTSMISTDPRFTVLDGPPPPIVIPENGSRSVTIRFAPVDSAVAVGQIAVATDICADTFFVSGGYPAQDGNGPAIRLVHPNGGERFVVGEETRITWSGVLPDDPVTLEYSTDAGAGWKTIATGATGLSHDWVVPNTPSNRCLARVSTGGVVDPVSTNTVTLSGHLGAVRVVRFSPDGTMVATGSDDESVKLWDPLTGNELGTLNGHYGLISDLAFTPDNAQLVTTGGGRTLVWSTITHQQLQELPAGANNYIAYLDILPSGGRMVTGATTGIVTLWERQLDNTWKAVRSFTMAGRVTDVAFAPSGNHLLIGGQDGVSRLIDAADGSEFRRLESHGGQVASTAFNRRGTQAVTSGFDGAVKVWNFLSQKLIAEAVPGTYDARFSPDGRFIIAGHSFGTEARIWDASTGLLKTTLSGHTDLVYSTQFSPNGQMVATASRDKTAKIWTLGESSGAASDISDELWEIVAPELSLVTVDMGEVGVGDARDSLVAAYLTNSGGVPVTIEAIELAGTAAADFSLVSGFPPVTLEPGERFGVEFRFAPSAAGLRNAIVEVTTPAGVLQGSLFGVGIMPQLEVIGSIIDFGGVEINTERDTVVAMVVRNMSAAPVEVLETRPVGPDTKQFRIIDGGGAFTLGPNEGRTMTLRFSPVRVGGTSGGIEFRYGDAGASVEVRLFGEGLCSSAGGTAHLELPSIEGAAGDSVTVPLIVTVSPEMMGTGEKTFFARIRFNPTLLLPLLSDTDMAFDQEDELLSLKGVWDGTSQRDTVAWIRFLAALGNAPSTPLELDAWVEGCPVELTLSNGEFRLNDLCEQGGERLFFAEGELLLKPLQPNPARDVAAIEYELIESGKTRLLLVDPLGREVRIFLDGEVEAGRYLITADISSIPSGIYFCVLHTPSGILMRSLNIQH